MKKSTKLENPLGVFFLTHGLMAPDGSRRHVSQEMSSKTLVDCCPSLTSILRSEKVRCLLEWLRMETFPCLPCKPKVLGAFIGTFSTFHPTFRNDVSTNRKLLQKLFRRSTGSNPPAYGLNSDKRIFRPRSL